MYADTHHSYHLRRYEHCSRVELNSEHKISFPLSAVTGGSTGKHVDIVGGVGSLLGIFNKIAVPKLPLERTDVFNVAGVLLPLSPVSLLPSLFANIRYSRWSAGGAYAQTVSSVQLRVPRRPFRTLLKTPLRPFGAPLSRPRTSKQTRTCLYVCSLLRTY